MKSLLSVLLCLLSFATFGQVADAGADTVIYKNQDRLDTIWLRGDNSVGTTFQWSQSATAGNSFTIDNPSAKSTFATGHFAPVLNGSLVQFTLTVNGTLTDVKNVYSRDYQQKGVNPCRSGYDTTTKTGGLKFTLNPSSSGTGGFRYNYNYINRDNIFGQQVQGGDTIMIKGNSVISFQLGDFGGNYGCPVYVMPKDSPLVLHHCAFYIAIQDSNAVQHTVWDGTQLRGNGYPYGFMIDNSALDTGDAGLNTAIGIVSDITLKGFYRYNTGIFQIKLDAGGPIWATNPNAGLFYDKFRNKKIIIDDHLSIVNDAEGYYLGDTKPEGGQNSNPYGGVSGNDTISVSNVVAILSGYDAIQVANARYSRVKYCLAASAGRFNIGSQRDGIFLGGGSSGRIDSCIVGQWQNRGFGVRGNPLSCFGYGVCTYQGNILDSASTGGVDLTTGSTGIYTQYLPQVLENYSPLSFQGIGNLINRTQNADKIRLDINTGKVQVAGLLQDNHFFSAGGQTFSQLVLNDPASTFTNNTVSDAPFTYTIDTVYLTPNQPTPWAMKITQGGEQTTVTSVKQASEWLWMKAGYGTETPPEEPTPSGNGIKIPKNSKIIFKTF